MPAAGQGALGVECLASRDDLKVLVAPLDHAETALVCPRRTRGRAARSARSCVMPLGAYARPVGGGVHMRGVVASPDGTRMATAEASAADRSQSPEAFGERLAEQLLAGGARDILTALAHG